VALNLAEALRWERASLGQTAGRKRPCPLSLKNSTFLDVRRNVRRDATGWSHRNQRDSKIQRCHG
jgi:hypothetical protein